MLSNTYTDAQARLLPLIDKQWVSMGEELRKGKPVQKIEQRLLHLNLIEQASAYWNPGQLGLVNTYLNLTTHV